MTERAIPAEFVRLCEDAGRWRDLVRRLDDGLPKPGDLNSLQYRRAEALRPRPGDFLGIGKGYRP